MCENFVNIKHAYKCKITSIRRGNGSPPVTTVVVVAGSHWMSWGFPQIHGAFTLWMNPMLI